MMSHLLAGSATSFVQTQAKWVGCGNLNRRHYCKLTICVEGLRATIIRRDNVVVHVCHKWLIRRDTIPELSEIGLAIPAIDWTLLMGMHNSASRVHQQ